MSCINRFRKTKLSGYLHETIFSSIITTYSGTFKSVRENKCGMHTLCVCYVCVTFSLHNDIQWLQILRPIINQFHHQTSQFFVWRCRNLHSVCFLSTRLTPAINTLSSLLFCKYLLVACSPTSGSLSSLFLMAKIKKR